MALPQTNTVVRIHPGKLADIRVEQLPTPTIEHPDDAIVKVLKAGLCGSDLHAYRGLEPFTEPYICGHELIGEVVALGSAFGQEVEGRPALYGKLKVGDKVVSPFTCSCEECHFCRIGFPSRCVHSLLFGSPYLPGAQAQYARIPKAGGTLFLLPPSLPADMPEESFMLCGDILPTGYFAALQALGHPNVAPIIRGESYPGVMGAIVPRVQEEGTRVIKEDQKLGVAIVGLGPVGICGLVALLDILSQANVQTYKVYAVDPVPARRAKALAILKKMKPEEAAHVEVLDIEEAKEKVTKETVKGCDAVLEIVGNDSALVLAYDLLRPFGVISSVGVHTSPQFPLNGDTLYTKNVSASFGRCPVRAMFPLAVDLLVRRRDVLAGVGGEEALVERVIPMSEAVEGYEKFDSRVWGKVVFDPWA
ncbi:hypothetical protein DACRYDRAFT_85505 [Dacryopinax primogenitus]|uniref:GroES-like protein n=1 Tax=Dacryopinax primogenitus (strain DJM 731) TaxID=1858805 RepID=M5FP37_DACPD|nr:uncharacterized protein DACRYDRAFT_85505 [Dacryopinax primogenitus]EJT96783.1 hypothetical protein DACRYDRAFT_85505 [Dacryopinax primogenitus]